MCISGWSPRGVYMRKQRVMVDISVGRRALDSRKRSSWQAARAESCGSDPGSDAVVRGRIDEHLKNAVRRTVTQSSFGGRLISHVMK